MRFNFDKVLVLERKCCESSLWHFDMHWHHY